jgi:ribosome-associated translation inhibitor RaiA
MQIQINTDHNIDLHEASIEKMRQSIESSLSRYGTHITRVEVHLSDENADKSGGPDKRCLIEARFENRQPLATSDHATNLDTAIHGAVRKLTSLIESTLGRAQ